MHKQDLRHEEKMYKLEHPETKVGWFDWAKGWFTCVPIVGPLFGGWFWFWECVGWLIGIGKWALLIAFVLMAFALFKIGQSIVRWFRGARQTK